MLLLATFDRAGDGPQSAPLPSRGLSVSYRVLEWLLGQRGLRHDHYELRLYGVLGRSLGKAPKITHLGDTLRTDCSLRLVASTRAAGRVHRTPRSACVKESGVSACAKGDAVRLLQAIDAQQAHGQVGTTVFAFAAACSAGLRPGTERYEEALWQLVWEGALRVDEHVPTEVAARLPFGRAPYRLTPAAMRMLTRA
jgi:hypothetical protein